MLNSGDDELKTVTTLVFEFFYNSGFGLKLLLYCKNATLEPLLLLKKSCLTLC